MTTHVQPTCSRATMAQLEPSFLRQQAHHREVLLQRSRFPQELAIRLSLLLVGSFLLLSSPLSCEVISLNAQPKKALEQSRAKLATYQVILELIDSFYVEERHVSGLIDSIVRDVLTKLDPHSNYIDP